MRLNTDIPRPRFVDEFFPPCARVNALPSPFPQNTGSLKAVLGLHCLWVKRRAAPICRGSDPGPAAFSVASVSFVSWNVTVPLAKIPSSPGSCPGQLALFSKCVTGANFPEGGSTRSEMLLQSKN